MPGTTSRGFPYPTDTDPIDVAGDMQALAESIDSGFGDLVNVSNANKLASPHGVLGHMDRYTNAGPIVAGTPAAISGLAFSFTTTSGRRVQFLAYMRHLFSSSPSAYGAIEIRNNGTDKLADGLYLTGGTDVGGATYLSQALTVSHIINLGSGTYNLSVWVNPAVGNIQVSANAVGAAYIAAVDLGPGSLPFTAMEDLEKAEDTGMEV
jgi:hypothetical protein